MRPSRSTYRTCRRACRPGPAGALRAAFTLIELMFIMALLGILAAMIVPHYVNVSDQANDSSVRRNLQILRSQIAYYRARENQFPDLLGQQWAPLLQRDYVHSTPKNPMNNASLVAAAAGPGVGWVWRDNGYGALELYATDEAFAELVE